MGRISTNNKSISTSSSSSVLNIGQKKKPKPHVEQRKRRFRPGTVARREVIRLQRQPPVLIRKSPLERLLKVLCVDIDPKIRFRPPAVMALRQAVQNYVVKLVHDANLISPHPTVTAKQMELVQRIRGECIAP